MSASSSKQDQPRFSWRTAAFHSIGLLVWVVVSFIGAQLLTVFGFQALAALFPSLGDLDESVLQFVLTASVYVLTLALVISGSLLARQKISAADLGVNKPVTWLDILLSPAAFVGYMIVSSLTLFAISQITPSFDLEQAQEIGFQAITGSRDLLLAFLALVVVAPLAEEVVFRGYLYGKMRKYTGIIVATVLTSALFGAVHMQWNVAIDTFVLSVAMCGLREITGSIWAGTIVHMIKNGLAFFLLFIYPTMGI